MSGYDKIQGSLENSVDDCQMGNRPVTMIDSYSLTSQTPSHITDNIYDVNQFTYVPSNMGREDNLSNVQMSKNFRREYELQHGHQIPGGSGEAELISASDPLMKNPLLPDGRIPCKDDVDSLTTRNRYVKEIREVININSIQRQVFSSDAVEPRDPDTGIYIRQVVKTDENGNEFISLEEFDENILNAEFTPGENDVIRPYIRNLSNDIIFRRFMFPNPNSYEIQLSRAFTNVKSIRLLSTEIPNVYNVVNKYNNIITLDIIDLDKELNYNESQIGITRSIPIRTGNSFFNYLLIQLPIGSYDFQSLLQMFQTTLNEAVSREYHDDFHNLFTVTGNTHTGKVKIKLNDPEGRNLAFHLAFTETVRQYTDLWYILGFPSPMLINPDSTPRHVKEMTNLFDFGQNPIFQRLQDQSTITNGGQLTVGLPSSTVENYRIIRPYRRPDLNIKYIYLVIEGLGAVEEVLGPDQNVVFDSTNVFAKILLNVPLGETAYNTFISNPKIFVDSPLPRLDRLKIRWIDPFGLPVDFQGVNHSFTLELVTYIDKIQSTGFDSKRGVIDRTSAPNLVKNNI